MSDTAFAGYWEQIVPKRFIIQGLRPDILTWLQERQKRLVSKYGVKDPRIAAFIIFDDVIADQKIIRYNADLQKFFVQGRHLAITVFIASQYAKGVGPMVRSNCDYLFLQPIYDHNQREVLWGLEAGFMDKKEWMQFMDEVIHRELLPGNSAEEPKKTVRIMVCADFEDSSEPTEKFLHWTPVPMDQLPKFKLLAAQYWKDNDRQKLGGEKAEPTSEESLQKTLRSLGRLQVPFQ